MAICGSPRILTVNGVANSLSLSPYTSCHAEAIQRRAGEIQLLTGIGQLRTGPAGRRNSVRVQMQVAQLHVGEMGIGAPALVLEPYPVMKASGTGRRHRTLQIAEAGGQGQLALVGTEEDPRLEP